MKDYFKWLGVTILPLLALRASYIRYNKTNERLRIVHRRIDKLVGDIEDIRNSTPSK